MKRALEGVSATRWIRATEVADTAGLLAFIEKRQLINEPTGVQNTELANAVLPDFAPLTDLALLSDASLARREARRLGNLLCATTAPAALNDLQSRVAELPAPAALWLHEEGVFHLGRWVELVITLNVLTPSLNSEYLGIRACYGFSNNFHKHLNLCSKRHPTHQHSRSRPQRQLKNSLRSLTQALPVTVLRLEHY